MDQKTLIITCGEPAGVGSEIIEKSLSQLNDNHSIIICGDKSHFSDDFVASCDAVVPLSSQLPTKKFKRLFYHLDFEYNVVMGEPHADYAPKILQILHTATLLCLQEPKNAALITAPIQKDTIARFLPDFCGHTDYIANICSEYYDKEYMPVMMLTSPALKVVPLTTHIPLRDVPYHINYNVFKKTVSVLSSDLKNKYNIENPHIAVAGLNPHAGDNGTIGQEEQDFIIPILNRLKKEYNISGPYAADAMFHKRARENYDVALCMYHDQALIPLKTIAFDEGVNTTLGLPIIRTSPDHGTAINIAGKNIARESAMVAALNEAITLLNHRNKDSATALYKQAPVQNAEILPD